MTADERGSLVAITSGSGGGSATSINNYDNFGIPQSSNLGRFQYTGQVWLPEAGLYHYKSRTYSPQISRFMEEDPIGNGDGMNMYAYAHNDPMDGTDPLGLSDDKKPEVDCPPATCVIVNGRPTPRGFAGRAGETSGFAAEFQINSGIGGPGHGEGGGATVVSPVTVTVQMQKQIALWLLRISIAPPGSDKNSIQDNICAALGPVFFALEQAASDVGTQWAGFEDHSFVFTASGVDAYGILGLTAGGGVGVEQTNGTVVDEFLYYGWGGGVGGGADVGTFSVNLSKNAPYGSSFGISGSAGIANVGTGGEWNGGKWEMSYGLGAGAGWSVHLTAAKYSKVDCSGN